MSVDPKQLIDRLASMKSKRSMWTSLFDDAIRYATPSQTLSTGISTPGSLKTGAIYDSTGIYGSQTLASGLYGALCTGKWFGFKTGNADANENYDVKEYLLFLRDRLLDEILESNFGTQMLRLFSSLSVIGTPCIYLAEGENTTLSFSNKHISEYYIAENMDHFVDTVFREFSYTSRQAVQHFGLENVSESIRKSYGANKYEESFNFLHAVYPREDYDSSKRDNVNMPFASVYIGIKDKEVISESGYKSFPYMVPRWAGAADGNIYAFSPTMRALSETKMVNQMSYSTIRAAQKKVDPALNAPDYMEGRLNNKPRGVNYYKSGTKDRVEKIDDGGDVGLGLEMEQQRREVINRFYFVDLFLSLSRITKQMTVPEVMERKQEGLRILSSMLEPLQPELFKPLIERAFSICKRNGVFGEIDENEGLVNAPEALQGEPLKIEYTSNLAMSVKMGEVTSFAAAMETLTPLFQANQAAFDNVDNDEATRGTMERYGVPASFIRDWDAVKEMREARHEALTNETMAEKMTQAAGIAKDLSGKVDPSSVMKDIKDNPAAIKDLV